MLFRSQQSINISSTSENGSILQLTYRDNIPQRAQKILNAIAQAYKEESIEGKNSNAKNTLSFIDKQLIGVSEALQQSAKDLERYKSANIVIDPQQKGIMASQKLSTLESNLNGIEIQEDVLKKFILYIDDNKGSIGVNAGSIEALSTPILSLIEKIQAAANQHSSLVIDYTDNHPAVIKINEQLRKLKADLRGTIESSLRGLQHRKHSLKQIIIQQKITLAAIPTQEMELSQLSNSFSVNQKIYEYLLQKRAETAIVESSKVSTVRVIDSALVGDTPIKPKRLLIVIVGFILGLIIGVAQAFLRNYLANTIHTIHDLEHYTNLPLYSVLPLFGERKSLYKDALRVLLTKLEFSMQDPKPKEIGRASCRERVSAPG